VSAAAARAQPQRAGALLLVSSVWLTLLVCQLALEPRLGRPAAVLLSFALALALVLATRARGAAAPPQRRTLVFALGLAAGLASYPAWIALIAGTGLFLGLERPVFAPPPVGAALAASTIGLAPLFEEMLYRERLLGALRERCGAAAAVLLSSAAFAACHVEPWAVLGTFLVGLGLGAAMCWTGELALCVGLHAGLNLAAWLST
jgi:membrane protease YdiL (CAAX protease family)